MGMNLSFEDVRDAYRSIERTIEGLEQADSQFTAHYWLGYGQGLLDMYSGSDLMTNAEKEEFERVISEAHNRACCRMYGGGMTEAVNARGMSREYVELGATEERGGAIA